MSNKLNYGFAISLVSCLVWLCACKSTNSVSASQSTENKSPQAVSASGIIQQQGITTYQYGTHVLLDMNGNTLYALKSDVIPLSDYAGRKVQLQGVPIEGYPIEGGPGYLEVLTIHE